MMIIVSFNWKRIRSHALADTIENCFPILYLFQVYV